MAIDHYLESPFNPNVCDVFKAAARDTWARIEFSRKTPRMKIHETTITQNLVYEMQLLKLRFPTVEYELFESINEKANGNDLELDILHADGNAYNYAVQAKIIYHNRGKNGVKLNEGHYKQFKHFVGKEPNQKNQIDLLMKYASDYECIPLYLLYNFIDRDFRATIDNELYGCTIVPAKYLKDNHTSPNGNLDDKVKFSDLHLQPAFPWHELICWMPGLDTNDYLDKLLIKDQRFIKSISSKPLPLEDKWLNLQFPQREVRSFSDASKSVDLVNSESDSNAFFNPRYKISVNTSNLRML